MQSSATAAPPCVEPAPASQTRMEEELAAPSTSTDKTDSMDVDGESKKLLGLGQKHLVMGNIPAAVNAFQEAASLLGKKYGETADECAEAFFYYGKSLLELARMENGVLGNALEGVQVEEEGEKAEDDSALPAADEEAREELREQVYNAMGEEAKKSTEESTVLSEKEIKEEDAKMKEITEEQPKEAAADKDAKPKEVEEKTEISVGKEETTSEEQKKQKSFCSSEEQKQVPVKEEAAVEEKEVEKEQKTVPEDKTEKATEEKERMTEVSDKKAKAAGEEAEAGEVAVEEKGEMGEQSAEATGKEPAVEKGEAVEGQAQTAVEEKAEAEEAAAVEQKEAAEGDAEVAEQKAEEKQEPVETVTEEKPGESKETESSEEPVPTEGKEPPNDMKEKAEVAAKVEKEEKKDDLMEEGEGNTERRKHSNKNCPHASTCLLETEESEEEDKENDKAEDDKENELTVEDKESEEDEIGNLELAWDMLELAKVIYKRQETKEAQLHAAQAHLKLGEVSIESENYTQAIEEFQACLALQQKYLEAHDRLLAESHYQLALAYHYNSDFDEAVLQFGKSMEVIDKRLAILTERIKKADAGSPEDEKEIEELKGLLPEIKEKIEDSKESQKSAKVAELGLKATLVGTTSGFAQSEDRGSVSTIPVRKGADGASQCVTDISHLVRKKRKPEEETHQGDNEAKKSKPEPAVNGGGGESVPSGNEVAEKMEEETEKRPQAESGAAVESTV
ncbi:PREDICTED: nuclear autoantigenic sperm protein isoform X2 [Pseudopodoces humilis]|uniref:nuclear autoantigenic sperm protein isoform X2 n=1 Tax=Pseudopodoces humilis TaxID=181119 RepID=UPI0006B82106|nr:PREDICTED: nuclear autoantigenic sperm protein isoform X2 [Pseudopodoces humilis]